MRLPPDPPPRRILITRLRFIGDVVLTTPVIRALRKYYAASEIYYLAEHGPADILDGHPDLNGLIRLDRERIDGLPLVEQFMTHIRFLAALRARRFDLVIDLFGNPRSALLTLATGARIRVGWDVRVRGAVYNLKIRRSSSLPVVDAYLDAVRTLSIPIDDTRPRVALSDEDLRWSVDWFKERDLTGHWPVICLNPGASWPAKMWGTGQFAELGDRLAESLPAKILLVHGPGQQSLVDDVAAQMRQRSVIVDLLPLKRLAAIIHHSHVFVSNDCGPMHIAAAVGTRTIGIFGPSRPDIWFPYPEEDGYTALTPQETVCCGRDICTEAIPCITTIPVDAVYEAVQRTVRVMRS